MCFVACHLGCEPRDRWFVIGYSPAPTGVRFGSHFENAYVTIWVECLIVSCFQYYWHASSSIEPPVDDSQSCPSAVHCRVACLRSVETHLVTSWFVLFRCIRTALSVPYVLSAQLMNRTFDRPHLVYKQYLSIITNGWNFLLALGEKQWHFFALNSKWFINIIAYEPFRISAWGARLKTILKSFVFCFVTFKKGS